MKRQLAVIAGVVLLIAASAWWTTRRSDNASSVAEPDLITKAADGSQMNIIKDPTLVFQKAFWRRPQAGDKIVHAERREWSTGSGIQKWQWFIEIRPGPAMQEWLRGNPFLLAASASPTLPTNFSRKPVWFPMPSADFQIQRNASGSMILMSRSDQKHLYASDSGGGFSPPN